MVQIPQRVRKPLLGRLDRVETLDEHFVEIQTASGAIATSVVHALKLILARLRGPVPSRRRVTLRWRRLSSRALLITLQRRQPHQNPRLYADRRCKGCKIYYEVNGIGPDVVFIHGEDHGVELFEQQVARLCGNYRCVAYYRRGHGRSELAPYGYSLRNQMLDLAGLLDHVEVRQAVIVAVAMATTIASYALEYPDRVKGLVLASWYELDGYPLMERRRSKKYKTTFAELHMQMFEIIRDHGQQGLIDHMIRKETHSFLFSRRTQQCGRKS